MKSETPIAQAKLVIPSKVDYLPSVRDLVESTSEQMGFASQEVQRIVTAAFEAVVNAATHGSPLGEENNVKVDVTVYPNRLVIEITDQGPGLGATRPGMMPDVASSRGRGLPLMQALMDEVHISNEDGGKITLVKYKC